MKGPRLPAMHYFFAGRFEVARTARPFGGVVFPDCAGVSARRGFAVSSAASVLVALSARTGFAVFSRSTSSLSRITSAESCA